MATVVLIPGADGRAWYWHRVAPLLTTGGHQPVLVDLPVSDPAAGLDAYADAVLGAVGDRRHRLVLVAQSLAGFVAPVVADRVPVALLVLLNAMVPRPGETAGQWWDATGQGAARAAYYAREGLTLPPDFDPIEALFHDVPADVVERAMAMGEPSTRFDTLFSQPWPLTEWPPVPTRFLQARDDRFFPIEFQRRVVKERLGMTIDEIAGGHLVALSQPAEVAEHIDAYARTVVP